jgi:hypothetical protein
MTRGAARTLDQVGLPPLPVPALPGRDLPQGTQGRIKAIIKAGVATAAIIKLLSNAEKNAAADPTLCKFVPSMGTIKPA